MKKRDLTSANLKKSEINLLPKKLSPSHTTTVSKRAIAHSINSLVTVIDTPKVKAINIHQPREILKTDLIIQTQQHLTDNQSNFSGVTEEINLNRNAPKILQQPSSLSNMNATNILISNNSNTQQKLHKKQYSIQRTSPQSTEQSIKWSVPLDASQSHVLVRDSDTNTTNKAYDVKHKLYQSQTHKFVKSSSNNIVQTDNFSNQKAVKLTKNISDTNTTNKFSITNKESIRVQDRSHTRLKMHKSIQQQLIKRQATTNSFVVAKAVSFSPQAAQAFQKAQTTTVQPSVNPSRLKMHNVVLSRKNHSLLKKLSNGTLYVTASGIKKGSQTYKEELESHDTGVKVVSQSLSSFPKMLRIKRDLIDNLKYKNRQRLIISKNSALIKTTKYQVNQLQKSLSLKKAPSELSQAQQELKLKRSLLRKQKVVLKKTKITHRKDFMKKTIVSPISSSVTKGATAYQNELAKDDVGVQVVTQGSSLIKHGTTHLNTVRKKLKSGGKLGNTSKNRMKNKTLKLTKDSKVKNCAITKPTLNKQIQKKSVKRMMLMNKQQVTLTRSISGTLGKINTVITNYFKNFSFTTIKKAILGKVALASASSLTIMLPVIAVLGFVLLMVSLLGGSMGDHEIKEQQRATIGVAQNLSPEVQKWRELVTNEANLQGMGDYINLILAIIQVESGGRGNDIMQSSESAGLPRNSFQPAESVRQGISYLKNIVSILKQFNSGLENEARLIAQSYNFGSPFASYVGKRGGTYDLSMAEDYSRTVVAPSLGNHNGTTYSYVNQVSQSFNKPYLYRNGGNFFYGELVGQYLGRPNFIEGDFAIVLAEIEKYNGWSYVWGGKSPQVGFDCSGLVAWGLAQIGVSLPSPAANQYHMTVPIPEAEAMPGDLIFFRGTYGGPNHISHVGFYIDANTMYDANGSGVGYHNWKSSYWQKFKPEIRRIVK